MTRLASHLLSRAAAGMAALLIVAGCDDPDTAEDSEPTSRTKTGTASEAASTDTQHPRIHYPDGSPPSADTVVARAGELRVTLADYERSLNRSLLFAPRRDGEIPDRIPDRQKASPRRQIGVLRSLLRRKIVRNEAERRDLEVTREERLEFVRNHDKLARFASHLAGDASASELPDGLGPDDIEEIADYFVIKQKLRRALVDEPSREELWELWRRQNDRIRIAYVAPQNAPDPEDVEAFLERDRKRDWKRIEAYLDEHPDQYKRPAMVKLAVVRPAPDQTATPEELERAESLLAEGRSADAVAEKLGWRAKSPAWLVPRENREAFEAEAGATGFETEGPRDAYAWRVEGHRDSQPADLKGGVRREIAADIMRESIVPSVREQLVPALDAMREIGAETFPLEGSKLEKLRSRIDELGLTLETTEFFPRSNEGRIPGIGLAEDVAERAAETTPEQPVVDEPVLARERAFVFRLMDRKEPSKSRFESNLESFRSKVVERRRERAVEAFTSEWLEEHDPSFHPRPLQVKYGKIEKK